MIEDYVIVHLINNRNNSVIRRQADLAVSVFRLFCVVEILEDIVYFFKGRISRIKSYPPLPDVHIP